MNTRIFALSKILSLNNERKLNTNIISTDVSEIPLTITPPDWNNKRLFALLGPLIAEQLLIVSMGIIDMVMVSSAGEHAVSGISLVESINFLIVTAFNAMATGGAVVVSQYIGRRDVKNACCSARQLVYISVFTSIILTIFTMIFCGQMLRLVYGNISPDVMQAGRTYFFFTALSYPFLALFISSSALFRSMGNSKITMQMAILMIVIKVAGNFLFINGMGLGVAGAALSSFFGRGVAAFLLVYFLLGKRQQVVTLNGIMNIKPEPAMIKRILNIGVPSGLETCMFQIGKILVTRIFTAFGTAAIAANAVSATINSIGFMPGSGYGIGLLIIAGQFIGAGDYESAKRYTRKILIMSYLTYFFININIFIFSDAIIGIFNLSPEAHALCKTFIRIHCVMSALFWCLSFVLPNTLKASGDVRYVMIIAACTMWIVRVCSAYILAFPLGLGPVAVPIAMGADFIFRSIFFTARYLRGRWMQKRVI